MQSSAGRIDERGNKTQGRLNECGINKSENKIPKVKAMTELENKTQGSLQRVRVQD